MEQVTDFRVGDKVVVASGGMWLSADDEAAIFVGKGGIVTVLDKSSPERPEQIRVEQTNEHGVHFVSGWWPVRCFTLVERTFEPFKASNLPMPEDLGIDLRRPFLDDDVERDVPGLRELLTEPKPWEQPTDRLVDLLLESIAGIAMTAVGTTPLNRLAALDRIASLVEDVAR